MELVTTSLHTQFFLQLVHYSYQFLILKTEAVPETPEFYSRNSFISFEDFIRMNLIQKYYNHAYDKPCNKSSRCKVYLVLKTVCHVTNMFFSQLC